MQEIVEIDQMLQCSEPIDLNQRPDFSPVLIMNGDSGEELHMMEAFRVTTVLTLKDINTEHPKIVRADFVFDARNGLESPFWRALGIRCMDAVRKVTDEEVLNPRLAYGCDAL
jgi:hypothetical protein